MSATTSPKTKTTMSVDPTTGIAFHPPTPMLQRVVQELTEEQYQESIDEYEARRAPVRDEMGAYTYERFRYLQENLEVDHLDTKIENLAKTYHYITQQMLTIKCARGEL